MSRLEELLQTFCPHGVDNKNLDQVCSNIFAGGTPSTNNSDYYNGNIPWLRSGEINFNHIDKTNFYITKKGLENSSAKWIKRHSVLIAMTGATVARSGINNIPLTANQSVCALETNELVINYRYLFYCLSRDYEKIRNMGQGVLTSLNITNIKKIVIPVPPLSVQKEIVRTLDTFTALESELEKELDARTKQYETYRDALLNFDPENPHPLRPARLNELIQTLCPDGVDFASLGEVSQYSKIRIPAFDVDSQTYVGVDNLLQNKLGKTVSDYVPTSGSLIGFGTGDILIGNIRPYLKKIWLSDIFGGTNGDVLVIQILDDTRETVSPKYLFYVLSSDNFFEYNVRYSKGAKMPRGDKQSIMNYQFYLPPLPVQEEIVAILDRFDALVNDLKIGLPAEIAARRKQYEYYRDQLLTFKPLP